MIVGEPATANLGMQETVVVVTFIFTARLAVPTALELLESPP